MLDGRVLAAVFASLAAIGAAMNGGAVNAVDLQPQNMGSSGDFGLEKHLPKSLQMLKNLQQNPEPTKKIEAHLEVNALNNQGIQISNGVLRARNVTSIEVGDRKVESDEEVKIYGYTGKVLPGKPSNIDGRAKGAISSGVNISGNFKARDKLETGLIKVENTERSKIKLKDIKGDIESNSTSARIRDSDIDLDINSFSGNITIDPRNETVRFSGKIDKLSAGDVSFGG